MRLHNGAKSIFCESPMNLRKTNKAKRFEDIASIFYPLGLFSFRQSLQRKHKEWDDKISNDDLGVCYSVRILAHNQMFPSG